MKYTIKLGSCIDGTVPLGWQNENKVKEVYFDASKWVAEYGAGILTLAIQRNGDAQPYPKALTDDTWTIEAVDVEKKGIGEFQVTFTVGEQVKESAVYKFFVERSLDSTGEMPDPYISYFEQIIEVGAQAEADADRAEEAADSIKNLTAEAETLPAGSSASASYDSETGVMTFGIPQGEQGERGADGVTPDIDIGTVETLETGVPAYANITGTVENPSLNLGLPKGNTGDTGATGAPAGFGAVTATIDGTTGTPSVDVTASGADTAKNFAFAFHNLKGEQGEQGEQGDPGVVQDVTVNGASVVDQNGVAVITMPELVKTVQGNPIVIDDAFGEVKNLDVGLLPIQDLHGYDKPWSGGAGKNILPNVSNTVTDRGCTAVYNDNKLTLTGTATASGGRVTLRSAYFSLKAGTYYSKVFNKSGTPAPTMLIQNGGTYLSTDADGMFTLTADSDSMNFGANVTGGETYNFTCMLAISKENITEWTPYSNICPITGHDSVTVGDTGVNQWDEEWEVGALLSGGSIDASATARRTTSYIKVLEGKTYYMPTPCLNGRYAYYKEDRTLLSYNGNGFNTYVNTIPSGAKYLRITLASSYGTTYNHDISINYPSTDTAYHAYHGQSKTVTLPHTVYGGKPNITTGNGTENIAIVSDASTLNWQKSAISGITYFFVSLAGKKINNLNMLCSVYPTSTAIGVVNSPDKSITASASTDYLFVRDSDYTEVAPFKTAMSGVQICYELATPTDLSTTPTDITLYNGDNVISSDGDMELTYVQDMATVIRKIEAQL